MGVDLHLRESRIVGVSSPRFKLVDGLLEVPLLGCRKN